MTEQGDIFFNRNSYRARMRADGLVYFRVTEGETDLYIGAARDLSTEALAAVKEARSLVSGIIERRPRFQSSLSPLEPFGDEAEWIMKMYRAGQVAGTGPMAAVAGMIAEYTARALVPLSAETVVENGGDVFMTGMRERTVAIVAGNSPISGKLGLKVLPGPGLSVCTSSGTYGHSLSFGKADAAVVSAADAALADAVATMLGNKCKDVSCLEQAVEWAAALPGVCGAAAVMGDRLAAAGQIEFTAL